MCENNYVLAMYDVRGKQDYIFSGRKIKEIVGGSLVIKDIFKNYLLVEGNNIHSYNIRNVKSENEIPQFSWESFRESMENESSKDGEVIYDGGGNFLVLFRDEATFNRITHQFTLNVLKATASLRVIGTCVKVKNKDDFESDRKALYEKHRITESTIQNVPRFASIPMSMVSSNSSLPIVYRGCDFTKEEIELTAEQLTKYKKYEEYKNNNQQEDNEKILDNIAPEKGVDSHVAIIYIDGNSMGAKLQKSTADCQECTTAKCRSYDNAINALRKFSWRVQQECIDSKTKIIDKKLAELHGDKDNPTKRRFIIQAGDEINLIVPGRDAFEVAKAYLEALKNDDRNDIYSSCAGIAIFRSHMPYIDAYRIAEQCCESGKKKMKDKNLENTSFLDYHLCQGAIDVSLEQIRENEETQNPSRPWLITDCSNEVNESNDSIVKYEQVKLIVEFLQKIGHGNAKGLLLASRESDAALELELRRIKAHQTEKKQEDMENVWNNVFNMNSDLKRKIIYDVVLMFDLWFKKGEVSDEENNKDNS